jgi:hypothetical protein
MDASLARDKHSFIVMVLKVVLLWIFCESLNAHARGTSRN